MEIYRQAVVTKRPFKCQPFEMGFKSMQSEVLLKGEQQRERKKKTL